MTPSPSDDPARQWARRHTAPDSPCLAAEASDTPLAIWVARAWAVKDDGQAAWTEEPPRTRRCASLLAQLRQRWPNPEIDAAGAWCDGLAALVDGRMDEALARLNDASRALESLGQARRAAQARVPMVIALTMLGRHDDALASGQQTLTQLVAAGDGLAAGKVEMNLGWMLMRRDRYDEAMVHFRGSAVRFARAGDVRHSVMADVGLAGARTWRFEFDEALRLYDRCSMRAAAHGLASIQSGIDTHRGRLELHRGRYEAALRSLGAALRQAEIDGRPHDLAETRRGLANAYLALNLLPEAIRLYGQTIEACVALQAPVERAWAEVQRALALTRSGDLAAAAQGLTEARHLFEAAGNDVGIALTGLRQAALWLHQGEAAPAWRAAQAAATALESAGVIGWQLEAELLAADALARLGRHAEARVIYTRVLEASAALPPLRAACHTGLGELLRTEGDAEAAAAQWRAALHETELQRETLPSDEFRTAFGADKQGPFEQLVMLALEDQGPGAAWRLLRAIEQARAPSLRSALQRRDAPAAIDSAVREQLRWLQAQWQQAITGHDLARAAALDARRRDIEDSALEDLRRAHAAAGMAPQHGAAVWRLPEDEAELRAQVPPGTAIVVCMIVGDRMVACVVTRERVRSVVASAQGLVPRLKQLRFQIDGLRFGAHALKAHSAQMAQRCRAHLQGLHALVWQPLVPLLAGHERVVVVPHRELHYLPFAGLHDGTCSLVERHEISLAPGLSLWLDAAAAPRPWRRVAALGMGGAALPHVEREVRAVAAAFEACEGGSAVMHLEGEATQIALRNALPGADVLHLACHGQFRADSPYFSALHLADGPLTVRDAAGLPLSARLVTLSACETGLSKVAPGDEALGLLRGFLMAGAPRVLATYWTVDDASTAALMSRFYAALLAGAAPSAALRDAQCALMRDHSHPYHWAAFALHERGH